MEEDPVQCFFALYGARHVWVTAFWLSVRISGEISHAAKACLFPPAKGAFSRRKIHGNIGIKWKMTTRKNG